MQCILVQVVFLVYGCFATLESSPTDPQESKCCVLVRHRMDLPEDLREQLGWETLTHISGQRSNSSLKGALRPLCNHTILEVWSFRKTWHQGEGGEGHNARLEAESPSRRLASTSSLQEIAPQAFGWFSPPSFQKHAVFICVHPNSLFQIFDTCLESYVIYSFSSFHIISFHEAVGTCRDRRGISHQEEGFKCPTLHQLILVLQMGILWDPFWILFFYFLCKWLNDFNSYQMWKNLAAASCRTCKIYFAPQEVREMIPDVAIQPPQAIPVSELAKNIKSQRTFWCNVQNMDLP